MAHRVSEPPFFGRVHEIKYLRNRIVQPGLTVLAGRPQIGKSRLLQELLTLLRNEKEYLIGYHRSSATESAILYAAADLYVHAITDASWKSEMNILYKTRKGGLPVRVGAALGHILAEATPSIIKAVFQKTFNVLTVADETLRTGGGRTILQPVTIDEARALLELAGLAGNNRPLLLIIDQWEDGLNLDHEATIFRTYLQEMAQWPERLHIILHLRHPADDDTHVTAIQAWTHVQDFKDRSAFVKVYELPPIIFDKDKAACKALMKWLRELLPSVVSSIPENEIVEIINGNPSVLKRWLDQPPKDINELKKLAVDAHAYQYVEIRNKLRQLRKSWSPEARDGNPFDVALRLIFLSELLDKDNWPIVESSVLQGAHPSVLDHLQEGDRTGPGLIIERDGTIPSLGLPKRRETAINMAITDETMKPHACRAFESLVCCLAKDFEFSEKVDKTVAVTVLIIASLESIANKLKTTGLPKVLTTVANILLGIKLSSEDVNIFLSNLKNIGTDMTLGQVRLLAMGLLNTLHYAKEEKDLTRRDALLDELRALYGDHRDDAAVREQMAKGLFNTLNHAKEEKDLGRRDALLDELRALYGDHRDDAAVREPMAKGLFNTLNDAKEEKDLARRDALLEELRALHSEYPKDPLILAIFILGLQMVILSCSDMGDKKEQTIAGELRTMVQLAIQIVQQNPHPLLLEILRNFQDKDPENQ